MFVGQYQFTLDKKKRLVIPAKFRPFFSENESGVYVTVAAVKHGELKSNYLEIYTPSAWQTYAEWVTTASLRNEEAKQYLRKISSDTEFCKLDSQWRLVIPMRLINAVGLKRDVMIVGVVKHIEVWDLTTWVEISQWLKEHVTDLERYLYRQGN